MTVAALLLGVIVCLTLREPRLDTSEAKAGSMNLLRDGAQLLRHHRRLRQLTMLVVFTAPLTATLVTTLGPPYLIENDAAPFLTAAVLSLGSLLAAFSQRYAYKLEEWLGQARAIALLILLPGAIYWLLAAAAGPAATVLIMILLLGVADMKAPLFSAYQNALIESKNRATVLSLINMCLNLFIALAAPLFASIAETSLTGAFLAIGAMIVAAGLLLRAHRLPQTAAA